MESKKLNNLKMDELKEQLEKRELSTVGLKLTLQGRLREALRQENQDPEIYEFEIHTITEEKGQGDKEEEEKETEKQEEAEPKGNEPITMEAITQLFLTMSTEQKTQFNKIDKNMEQQKQDFKQQFTKLDNKMEKIEEELKLQQENWEKMEKKLNTQIQEQINKKMEQAKEEITETAKRRWDEFARRVISNEKNLGELEKNIELGFAENMGVTEQSLFQLKRELERKIKENQENQQRINENFEKNINDQNWNYQGNNNQEKKQWEERIREQGLYLQELQNSMEKKIQKQMEELKQKDSLSNNSNCIPGLNQLYSILSNSSGSTNKFSGSIKQLHPKVFLRTLKNRGKHFNNFDDWKEFIRSNLTDQALTWFNGYENHINNFNDFEALFLRTYWGESNQSLLRERLYSGKFDHNKNSSMYNYALNLFSQAQFLEPHIGEAELIILRSSSF